MTLVNNLQSTMQAAMKSGDRDRVRTLRTLLAKLKEKSIEKGDDLNDGEIIKVFQTCLLYTSPSPRDLSTSRMPSSA